MGSYHLLLLNVLTHVESIKIVDKSLFTSFESEVSIDKTVIHEAPFNTMRSLESLLELFHIL